MSSRRITFSPTLLLPAISTGPEVRELARLGRERQRRRLPVRPIVFARGDLRVRIAVIAQLVERHFVRRHDELPIARLADLERHALLQIAEVRRRDDVEAGEVDRRDLHRLAFGDRDGEVDCVLLVVELDVEAGDAGVGDSRGRRRTPGCV